MIFCRLHCRRSEISQSALQDESLARGQPIASKDLAKYFNPGACNCQGQDWLALSQAICQRPDTQIAVPNRSLFLHLIRSDLPSQAPGGDNIPGTDTKPGAF